MTANSETWAGHLVVNTGPRTGETVRSVSYPAFPARAALARPAGMWSIVSLCVLTRLVLGRIVEGERTMAPGGGRYRAA
jgi:hypothetical protein